LAGTKFGRVQDSDGGMGPHQGAEHIWKRGLGTRAGRGILTRQHHAGKRINPAGLRKRGKKEENWPTAGAATGKKSTNKADFGPPRLGGEIFCCRKLFLEVVDVTPR